MAEVLQRRRRRRPAEGMLNAALRYAELGWPVCRGAAPSGA
ncbi:DNA primase, partial [Streptomonospora algeriensis]